MLVKLARSSIRSPTGERERESARANIFNVSLTLTAQQITLFRAAVVAFYSDWVFSFVLIIES